jgi:hypothetical protein
MGLMSFMVKLGLDGTQFETGMVRAKSAGDRFAADFKRSVGSTLASVFAVDKLAEYGKASIDLAGKLTDLSTRLGVSAEFLQEMGVAAEMGGASLDDVSASLEKLAISRAKALGGDAGMLESFKRFAIDAEQLKTLRIEEIFERIGAAFEGGANPQNLIGPLREIAGKSAGALIPAMVDGLGDAAQKARELGQVLSNDVVASLDEAGDRIEVMQRTLTLGIGSLIGNVIEPAFRFFEALGSAMATVERLSPSLTNPASFFGNPFAQMKFAIQQGAESFKSSLEEQDQAAADTAASRERRARLRETVNLEAMASGSKSASTVAQQVAFRQPQSTDPLARIGGFTQFGAGISDTRRMMEQQTRLLQSIASATKETAVKIDAN